MRYSIKGCRGCIFLVPPKKINQSKQNGGSPQSISVESQNSFFSCFYHITMCVIIGKQKCIQCDELKNLLGERGMQYIYWDITEMQYNYLDMTEMPQKTMTDLKMYCNSFPIVLNTNHSFSQFEETLTILIIFELFYIIFICFMIILLFLLLFIIIWESKKQ